VFQEEIKLLRNICLYSPRKWLCSLEESNYVTQEMVVFLKEHGCVHWRNGINKLFQVVCGFILRASIQPHDWGRNNLKGTSHMYTS
jgi:hypothetical protein